jgi:hypothetical protein
MANNRYFQYLVGDRRGEILVFDSVVEDGGDVYVVFKDDSRMNQNLIAELNQTDATGKLMAEIDSYQNPWRFEEKIVGEDTERTEVDWESQVRYEVPTVTEIASDGQKVPIKRKQINLIPPRRSTPAYINSRFGNVVMSQPIQPINDITNVQTNQNKPVTLASTSVNHSDPVYIMMDKSKKFETEVEMTLTMSLPPESLYNVAKESFDDGAEKTLEYIIENIDLTKIKEALKAGIRARYEKPDDVGSDDYVVEESKSFMMDPEEAKRKFPELAKNLGLIENSQDKITKENG